LVVGLSIKGWDPEVLIPSQIGSLFVYALSSSFQFLTLNWLIELCVPLGTPFGAFGFLTRSLAIGEGFINFSRVKIPLVGYS